MLSLARTSSSSARRALTLSRPSRAYHDNILDHYENPRNVGSLDKQAKNVGTGLVGAPACGDVMKLQFEVDDSGVITDAKFKTFGCGSAIASSSVATEWLKGRKVDDCLSIKVSSVSSVSSSSSVSSVSSSSSSSSSNSVWWCAVMLGEQERYSFAVMSNNDTNVIVL